MSSLSAVPLPTPQERAADAVHDLLLALGEKPEREGPQRTPERVAKAMAFLTSGHSRSARQVLSGAIFDEPYEGLVLVRDIEFYSLCEHHMLPFHGRAHVAYLPQGRIVGLSKLPRLVEVFARRLQVQERLTAQVAESLDQELRPRGVAVLVEAAHFCMMMRGIEKQHSSTTTVSFLGAFRESASLRAEFLASLGRRPGEAAPVAAQPRPGGF